MKKQIYILLCYLTGITVVSAQDVKLNQLGFYSKAEKTAVIPNVQLGNQFHIINQNTQDTAFSGLLTEPIRWTPSGESVSLADFSGLNSSGSYILVTEDGENSYPFEIKDDVYNNLLKGTIKAYYFQRSSTELLSEHAGRFSRALGHPDDVVKVHPNAASPERPAGTIVSGPKGWYDAGDYNKYVVNSGISTYSLMAAFERFGESLESLDTNIPESGDAVPDLLDEIKWNLDWMLTMQDPNDGGVYHKLSTKNFSGYIMPSQAFGDRFMLPKSTAATLDFAAVMAQASRVYEAYDTHFPGFAQTCYQAALDAWKWGREHPSVAYQQPADVSTGEYGDGNLRDEMEWAAIELYITTKADSFYTIASIPSINAAVPAWPFVSTLGLLSLANHRDNLTAVADVNLVTTKLIGLADQLAQAYGSSAYHIPMGSLNSDFVWGSNGLAANQSMILLAAFDLTNDGLYYSAAYANLDYLLGRNPLNYSFVTGFGSKSPRAPHHRPSIADTVADPIPGLLAGGPNPGQQDGCNYDSRLPALSYVDDMCSYASNEIAINWNAPLFFAIAGLTHAMRAGNENAPFIISQPVTLAVRENNTANLTVNAGGMKPMTYQWFKNDSEITGANAATFTVNQVTNNDESDIYKVVITNEKGSITSKPINIIISKVNLITNLDKYENSGSHIFPNPVVNKKLYFKTQQKEVIIVILDTQGRELQRNIGISGNHIDLSNLPSGPYIIRLMSTDQTTLLSSKKIILN